MLVQFCFVSCAAEIMQTPANTLHLLMQKESYVQPLTSGKEHPHVVKSMAANVPATNAINVTNMLHSEVHRRPIGGGFCMY
jgi:hypothetical protein